MSQKDRCYEAFKKWYEELPLESSGFPARGGIGAAFILLERLKTDAKFNMEAHRAKSGTQLRGATPTKLKTMLLDRYGIEKEFVRDGIRTNRGNIPKCEDLLATLRCAGMPKVSKTSRLKTLKKCQDHLAQEIKRWLEKRKLSISVDSSLSTYANLSRILQAAKEAKKDGAVSQHLVGAKLELRFPHLRVENETYTTADAHLGRHGDFQIQDTAFHVTVAPNLGHCERFRENIKKGLRPYLLVPERQVPAARNLVEDNSLTERVTLQSLESFLATNIDEMSDFGHAQVLSRMRELFDVYNRRIEEVEVDKSLKVEIPENLPKSN